MAQVVRVENIHSTQTLLRVAEDSVRIGDLVVFKLSENFYLGRVTGINQGGAAPDWIVDVVDLGPYIAQSTKRSRIEQIKAVLRNKASKYDETESLDWLKAKDQEAASLLAELKTLEATQGKANKP